MIMKTGHNEFRILPKADLHVHLNGAITTNTAIQLLGPVASQLPDWFNLEVDLQINSPVNGLQEYFTPWYALKKLPYSKECLDLMVESALISLAGDNVHYVELRNSPFNISLKGFDLPCERFSSGNQPFPPLSFCRLYLRGVLGF